MNTITNRVYRPCVFRDRSSGFAFLTRSTCNSDETILWEDGVTYPVIDVEVSSASHPAYTGTMRKTISESRVVQFNERFGITHKSNR